MSLLKTGLPLATAPAVQICDETQNGHLLQFSDDCILELDPSVVDTPPTNRTVTLDSIGGLVDSIREYGQLVVGIVSKNLDKDGHWWNLDGNRRLLACRVLGKKFRAVEHKGSISPGRLAATRIAANRNRKQMSDDELAADLEKIMEEDGCGQSDAAKKCGLSPTEANRCLKFQERAIEEVKKAVAEKLVTRDTGRAISTIPQELQKELLDQAIGLAMKSDAVELLAAKMRGKKPTKAKSIKVTIQCVTLVTTSTDPKKIGGVLAQFDASLKKLEKLGLPISALPSLILGKTTPDAASAEN